jgi:hypothetical protein
VFIRGRLSLRLSFSPRSARMASSRERPPLLAGLWCADAAM